MAVTTAGTPDFERVHEWLLERKGTCTEDDIENALPKLITTNADKFWDRYHGSATRDAIRADLDLAEQLGLVATPAVFINGQLIDSPDIEATIRRIADRLAHGP
jgi:protein-disulfide isomerase